MMKSIINSQKFKAKTAKKFTYLILIGFSIIFALPILWLVLTSLKTVPQLISGFKWLPNPIAWENYPKMMSVAPFPLYLKNTLIIIIFNLGGVLLINPLIAYSFARLRWPGRDIIFLITLGAMMLPYASKMLPLYLLFQSLNWINTFKPLIVPVWCGQAFLIFLLRQFFLTIPMELSDAAKIDGASEFGIFWRIIYPLAKPVLACVAIFEVIYDWNDFLAPLIYLNSQNKYTLGIGLDLFSGAHVTEWNLQMAYGVLMTIPMIIFFFFFARYFTKGLAMSGIKG